METENGRGASEPLPTVVGVFFAQVVQVISNPGHFLYEKTMDFLLRRALQDLADLPRMLQFSISVVGDEYQKEIGWILNVLTAGLRTVQVYFLYHLSLLSIHTRLTKCCNKSTGPKHLPYTKYLR